MGLPEHKLKIVGIIQDRTNNSRLPDKSLYQFNGMPMSRVVYERVSKSKLLDVIVVATTENRRDNVLCHIAKDCGLECFRGSENDVIARFYECAKLYKADLIVRICADNPLIEASEIDRIIEHAIQYGEDFCSNTGDEASTAIGYPDGLGAEVYTMEFLTMLNKTATDREHPHRNFKPDVKHKLQCPEELAYPDLRFDVNTRKDFDYISGIFRNFTDIDFNFTEYRRML
jgi:spore coat polysaccharide biosynthesis protein SpsF